MDRAGGGGDDWNPWGGGRRGELGVIRAKQSRQVLAGGLIGPVVPQPNTFVAIMKEKDDDEEERGGRGNKWE